MIQTDFKCQLREVSEVISWETVTVCSITSSLSHHCNPRIRCNDTLFPHISMKCTGFHPCDHIHMYRSDTIMDDLAGSLSAHTHTTLGHLGSCYFITAYCSLQWLQSGSITHFMTLAFVLHRALKLIA